VSKSRGSEKLMGEESWNGDGDMRGGATMLLFETLSFGKILNNNNKRLTGSRVKFEVASW
jgi:hypothetical protein